MAPSLHPNLVGRLFDGPIDVIGDVHGEIDALRDLLRHMDYGGDGTHAGGRRLVFIGDLTDRGPNSPAVVALVSRLVERGLAQCVMGNHELNLLRQARKDGNGWFYCDDHDRREGKFGTSQGIASDARPQLQALLERLPLALERPDLRLVHAAWDAPSIATVRSSTLSAVDLYDSYERASKKEARESGLEEHARAESSANKDKFSNPDADMPLLTNVAALDELYQMGNPVRIVTSGIERKAHSPFFASGKWRMVDRVRWWDDYTDATPVIVGHYWRWPTRSTRDTFSRGEPDLFAEYAPHQWMGVRRNVFCVDFAVGARYKEREAGGTPPFACRLAAVRWPEQVLIFDDGTKVQMVDA